MTQSLLFTLKTDQDDLRPVYLTGTFNHWKQEDPHFRMQRISHGEYQYELKLDPGKKRLRYRYLKGDINQEELDQLGNPGMARSISTNIGETEDYVPRWRLNGLSCSAEYLPVKVIIEEDFEIPQLNKRRRIWALLPCDYDSTEQSYPVLYLQDAQNLFNEHAPFGNWGIDERLGILKELGFGDLIIVAIEHGDEDRISEYSPFDTERFGPGEGKAYAAFIVETLKPYVDKKFRTKPHRIHTGIGGSSMGGLISAYTAITYPQVFSKWMIFSPSLWLSSQIFNEVQKYENDRPSFIYLYGGKKESDTMADDLIKFTDILRLKAVNGSLIHYRFSMNPYATHKEKYWGAEFPKAVQWLFYDKKK